MNDDGFGAIGYTLKEVIEKLDRKIDAMFTVMSLKADRADVAAMEHRVDQLERRMDTDQAARSSAQEVQKQRKEHWRWLLPLLVAVIGIVISVLAYAHGIPH